MRGIAALPATLRNIREWVTSYNPAMPEPDPITTYLETFDRLRAAKRWTTNTVIFRFVALTLEAAGPDVTYDQLEAAAKGLQKRARWTNPLKSEIRYVVAAMILRRGLDPGRIHARVVETRDAFKAHKIARRGTGPTLAALVLALQEEGRAVPKQRLERLAQIYRRWREDHFWLTDSNDLPAAALHEPVEALAANVERAYQSLREAGFSRGDKLQLVSQLLAVDPRGAGAGVQRFCRVADRLKDAGERVNSGHYDEIAMLALTQEAPARVVDRVLRYRDRLRAAKPRPPKDRALSLAAGIDPARRLTRRPGHGAPVRLLLADRIPAGRAAAAAQGLDDAHAGDPSIIRQRVRTSTRTPRGSSPSASRRPTKWPWLCSSIRLTRRTSAPVPRP